MIDGPCAGMALGLCSLCGYCRVYYARLPAGCCVWELMGPDMEEHVCYSTGAGPWFWWSAVHWSKQR